MEAQREHLRGCLKQIISLGNQLVNIMFHVVFQPRSSGRKLKFKPLENSGLDAPSPMSRPYLHSTNDNSSPWDAYLPPSTPPSSLYLPH